jgi:sugar/nucleoside kinase (ribokinase family)
MTADERVDFLAVGDLSVDSFAEVEHLPAADDKIWVTRLVDFAGGMMGNSAAVASQLGMRAAVVANLGKDSHGDLVIADLEHHGIDHRLVRRIDSPTFWALSLTSPGGDRALVQFPTPAFYSDPSSVDASMLANCRWVHTSLDQGDAIVPLLKAARAAGVSTSVDIEFPYVLEGTLDDAIHHIDVALINKKAAEALGGVEVGARALKSRGPSVVLVTLGADGCFLVDSSGGESIVAAHSVHPLDTNGAGDAFAGAFAAGRLHGFAEQSAAEFANVVAALSTTGEGGHGADLSIQSVRSAAANSSYTWLGQLW